MMPHPHLILCQTFNFKCLLLILLISNWLNFLSFSAFPCVWMYVCTCVCVCVCSAATFSRSPCVSACVCVCSSACVVLVSVWRIRIRDNFFSPKKRELYWEIDIYFHLITNLLHPPWPRNKERNSEWNVMVSLSSRKHDSSWKLLKEKL